MTALFDACAGFGGSKPKQRRRVSAAEWAAEMARLSIERALVRTAPDELDSDAASSNKTLFEACERFAGLVPCPVAIPDTAGEATSDQQQVDVLLARGAAAVCIRPGRDCWLMDEWACRGLFEALERRRVPVFCKVEEVPLQQAAELAGRYPELPVILADVGYRSQRVLLPLMKNFANVHASMGYGFSVHRGIEQFVDRVGPERLLFGTGFPDAEPMAAVSQLMYAEISDPQRELIGAGNLSRLLGGIRR